MRTRCGAVWAVLAAAGAARAQFAGTVTAGGVEFDLAVQAPFPNMGPMLLRPSNLVSVAEPGMSQLNQYVWYYYLPGDPRAYNFNDSGGQAAIRGFRRRHYRGGGGNFWLQGFWAVTAP